MDQHSCEFGEMTLYVRDHHVSDLKLSYGVSWVDVPDGGACGDLWYGCCAHGDSPFTSWMHYDDIRCNTYKAKN